MIKLIWSHLSDPPIRGYLLDQDNMGLGAEWCYEDMLCCSDVPFLRSLYLSIWSLIGPYQSRWLYDRGPPATTDRHHRTVQWPCSIEEFRCKNCHLGRNESTASRFNNQIGSFSTKIILQLWSFISCNWPLSYYGTARTDQMDLSVFAPEHFNCFGKVKIRWWNSIWTGWIGV